MLHYLLVGDLYPTDLPPRQRLHRQLAFRAGDPGAARRVLAGAVPPSLAGAGRALINLLVETLRPPRARPIDAAQAVKTLDRLAGELAPAFLAGGWETAGAPARALAILENHARTAPAEQVPWPTLQRLRAGSGRQGVPGEPTPPLPDQRVPAGPRDRLRALLALGPERRDAAAGGIVVANDADDDGLPWPDETVLFGR